MIQINDELPIDGVDDLIADFENKYLNYLHGECHVFALALRIVSSYKIGAILDTDIDTERTCLVHAYVQSELGIIDIKGLRTLDAVYDDFDTFDPYETDISDEELLLLSTGSEEMSEELSLKVSDAIPVATSLLAIIELQIKGAVAEQGQGISMSDFENEADLKSSEAKMFLEKWKQNDADSIESMTMDDAKEIVTALLDELKIPLGKWEPSVEAISPWDYMRFELGSQKLSVGVSSGGVVAVNGRPHAPDDLACNVTLDSVRRSLRNAVNEYVHVLITKVDSAAFVDIGHAEEAARIIRELADSLKGLGVSPGMNFPLKDANGNEVGMVVHSYAEYPPQDDAFVRVSLRAKGWSEKDVASMLEQAGSHIENGLVRVGVLNSQDGKLSGVVALGDSFRAQPEEPKNDGAISLDAA